MSDYSPDAERVSDERLDQLIELYRTLIELYRTMNVFERQLDTQRCLNELKVLRERYTWRPIASAPKWNSVLLYSPPENLSNHPDQRHDIRVNAPANFTWASHWMPLPMPPSSA